MGAVFSSLARWLIRHFHTIPNFLNYNRLGMSLFCKRGSGGFGNHISRSSSYAILHPTFQKGTWHTRFYLMLYDTVIHSSILYHTRWRWCTHFLQDEGWSISVWHIDTSPFCKKWRWWIWQSNVQWFDYGVPHITKMEWRWFPSQYTHIHIKIVCMLHVYNAALRYNTVVPVWDAMLCYSILILVRKRIFVPRLAHFTTVY